MNRKLAIILNKLQMCVCVSLNQWKMSLLADMHNILFWEWRHHSNVVYFSCYAIIWLSIVERKVPTARDRSQTSRSVVSSTFRWNVKWKCFSLFSRSLGILSFLNTLLLPQPWNTGSYLFCLYGVFFRLFNLPTWIHTQKVYAFSLP